VTWPPVFDGIGALFVRCDNDPDVQAERIPGLTWVSPKLNGSDITDPASIEAWMTRMRARGLKVGGWVWCAGPPTADVAAWQPYAAQLLDHVIYDVESPYKADEGGHYEWADELVAAHNAHAPLMPAAVTSYGAYKDTIDFGSFAEAGWPIFAQVYDSFSSGDETSYFPVYPPAGIHQLRRSLSLYPRQAVYRPESIDG